MERISNVEYHCTGVTEKGHSTYTVQQNRYLIWYT